MVFLLVFLGINSAFFLQKVAEKLLGELPEAADNTKNE